MRSNRLEKIALFGLVLLIVAVGIVIVTPPARQYELSIYATYPTFFWILIMGAMIAGLAVIVGSAWQDTGQTWIFGLLVVLLTNALLLLLPYIRGYLMYGRGDALSHIGFVQDIVTSGNIEGNIYPLMHLLVIAVADATGSDPIAVSMLVPLVFSVLYFGGIYFLMVHMFDSRERILLGLPLAILPILGHAHLGFRPFDVSVMLVPLALYLLILGQRNTAPAVRATFVVVLLSLLLYHPLTALFVVAIFFVYLIGKYTPRISKQSATPTNLVSLSAAVFLAWYSNFKEIIFRLDNVYTTFTEGGGNPPVAAYTDTVQESQPALIDLARVALFRYGTEMVLFALGSIFVTLLVALYVRKVYIPDAHIFMFAGTIVFFVVVGFVFLMMDLPAPHTRPWQFALVGVVVLAGEGFYVIRHYTDLPTTNRGVRKVGQATFTGLLIVLVVLSVFSVHRSPLVSEANHQVTEMEVDGAEWLTEHRTASDGLSEVGISYHRYHHAQYGVRSATTPFSGVAPPPHFNYTTRATLGQSYSSDRYLLISRKGRIVYPQGYPNYPENWRYTPSEFARVERDSTVNRIYDNGDLTQYTIEGTQGDAGDS